MHLVGGIILPPRILHVDDEENHLNLTKDYITRINPEITFLSVSSGKEALKILEQENFDLILADFQMPEMNGLELLTKIRQSGNEIPFVMYTGKGREEVAIQALNLGADFYFKKEGDPNTQYAELAHIINRIYQQELTKKQLAITEARYRSFIRNFQGIAFQGAQDFTPHFFHGKIEEMVGYSENDFLSGKISWDKIIHHEDLETVLKSVEEFMNSPERSTERTYRIITKSGKEKWILERISKIKDIAEGTNAVQGVLIDISQTIKTQEAFETLVESSSTALIILQDEKIVFCNAALTKLIGYSHKEIMAFSMKDLFEIIHPEDRKRAIKWHNKRLDGQAGVERYRFRVIRKEGSTQWAEIVSSNIVYLGRPAVQVAYTDITDQVKVELELDKIVESYLRFLETFPGVIFQIDKEGRILLAQGAIEEIFGEKLKKNALIFDLLERIVYQEDREQVDYELQKLMTVPNSNIEREIRIKHKTKGKKWIRTNIQNITDENGQITLIQGMLTDITEAKKGILPAERVRTEIEYQELVENLFEGVIVENTEGIITFLNPRAAEMLGYEVEELIGQRITNTAPSEELWKFRGEAEKRPKGISSTYEAVLQRKDGSRFPAIISATPLKFSTGKWRETLSVFTDITSQKELENLLTQQKTELSEFAHTIAHDLRNKISNIVGYSNLLLEGDIERDFVEKIYSTATWMNEFLRRTLELADAGKIVEGFHQVNLAKIIKNAVLLTVPSQITCKIADLPTVKGEKIKIHQIFENLLTNAVVHGNPTEINIFSQIDTDGINIFVTNDGTPIPAHLEDEIFTHGFTTKRGHLGIGLPLIKKIVEAHNWQITLESRDPTTFRIFIPSET